MAEAPAPAAGLHLHYEIRKIFGERHFDSVSIDSMIFLGENY